MFFVKDFEVLSLGLRSLFILEKRDLELVEPECMRCEVGGLGCVDSIFVLLKVICVGLMHS